MIDLNKKGYIFRVGRIKGRYGNLLICLENLLLLSKNTESIFTIKSIKYNYDLFKIPRSLDFRSDKNINCGEVIRHDRLFLTKHPYSIKFFVDPDKWCLNYIHNLLNRKEPLTKIYDDTLVLNIRGGRDIFKRKRINKEYLQPPSSFYKHIIKNCNHSDILIVTDDVSCNPVIMDLLLWKPDIRVADFDPSSHANLILNAKHLVTARSTFSMIFARLSKNLKSLYVWWDNNWKWDEWQPTVDNSLSKDFKITRCYTDDYIKIGEWSASMKQLKTMLNYPEEKLRFKEFE